MSQLSSTKQVNHCLMNEIVLKQNQIKLSYFERSLTLKTNFI